MAGFGPESPEFDRLSAIELTPGGIDSACHPSNIGVMSRSVLVMGALHQRHSRAPQPMMLPATRSLVLHEDEKEEEENYD